MQIGMLGPLEVCTGDGVLAVVPGARLRGLLVALALKPGHVVPKATLVDWIWGERPPSEAANALQCLVSRLRKALPDGLIEGHADGYRLMVDPDVVDAVRFERLVVQARNVDGPRRTQLLREATDLWRGAAMQDVGLPDSETFDAAVTRLEGLRLTAMEDRFDAEISVGNGVELVAELTDLVAAHPLRERLVAALMRSLVAAGRDSEALLAYQRTREALAEELGVDPSAELSTLHVALLRGEVGWREENRKTNVRAELTSFVGRDADVAVVRELTAEHRLTTLIGPGGSGKTRLATESARTMIGDLPDGIWLVEFARIGTDGDVALLSGPQDLRTELDKVAFVAKIPAVREAAARSGHPGRSRGLQAVAAVSGTPMASSHRGGRRTRHRHRRHHNRRGAGSARPVRSRPLMPPPRC